MSWATVERVVRPDGSIVAIKHTTYDARIEAAGLELLEQAGAPVPEVLDVTSDRLIMPWLDGPADWPGLGRALASVHRESAPAFGLDHDNFIGSLVQVNDRRTGWGRFFSEARVRVHLDDPAVPRDLAWRLNSACDGPLPELLDAADPRPSLIHGDLWAGNVVAGRWFVDPAVTFADREMELAFMTMFGGIPASMFGSYLEVWPLSEGWEERRHALRLHHLLVHVRLFGAGYVDQLSATLERLSW